MASTLFHLSLYHLLERQTSQSPHQPQKVVIPIALEISTRTSGQKGVHEIPLSALRPGRVSKPSSKVGATTSDLRSLWRSIDRNIEENPFLSEYNHTGQVLVRFEVDQYGRLQTSKLQVLAGDRVLKVIATRAIRRALLNEAGGLRFPTESAIVNARFTWSSYQACKDLRGHQKNYLSFCHFGEPKRKSFSKGEKIVTFATAIVNNGPWAVEEIQKYNREESHRKTQFNPFEELERDPDWNL